MDAQFTHIVVTPAGAHMIGTLQECRLYIMKHGLRAVAVIVEA